DWLDPVVERSDVKVLDHSDDLTPRRLRRAQPERFTDCFRWRPTHCLHGCLIQYVSSCLIGEKFLREAAPAQDSEAQREAEIIVHEGGCKNDDFRFGTCLRGYRCRGYCLAHIETAWYGARERCLHYSRTCLCTLLESLPHLLRPRLGQVQYDNLLTVEPQALF